mmetsp:Transcript_30605/g.64753  ORF Transcript_30605/g.64753 Transcript_30605/m.64753 type:complete len:1396 (+) Transcript_30605:36-4223(+)
MTVGLPLIPLLAGGLTFLALPGLTGSSKEKSCASGLLCDVWTIVSSIVVVAAWASCDLHFDGQEILSGPDGQINCNTTTGYDVCLDSNYPTIEQVSEEIVNQCGVASLILGTAMFLEFFVVIAHRSATDNSARSTKETEARGNRDASQQTIYTLFGWSDSECMLLVYSILFAVHICMSYDSTGDRLGLVFAEPVAAGMGKYRPVSTIRYIEWSIASPLLMSLIGRSIPRLEEEKDKGKGHVKNISETLRPALIVTCTYIFLSWMALAVIDPIWRWLLIFVSFTGFCCSTYDQLTTWRRNMDKSASDILLKVQVVIYAMYGLIYLLSLFDIMDPITEQAALTFADSTIKLACSASLSALRHADALAEAKSERSKADSIAADLKRMIHNANAPIFTVDLCGKVTLWNNKLASLTGALHDVIGRSLESILSPDCREEVLTILAARKAGKSGTEQFHCDFKIAPYDSKNDSEGHEQLVSLIITATARHDADGRIVGIFCVGQDNSEVTRIKVIEEKKNQFMAVVSHELKSPLHGIIGLSESLSQGEREPHRKEQLKMVKSCATRLLDLVSNIMQMSRLQRDRGQVEDGGALSQIKGGMKKLRKDPVDIASIISEVSMLIKNATDKGNNPILSPLVSFENKVPSGRNAQVRLPIVEGDAYKLTQVIYNLLTNACKFCTSGSITIEAAVNSSKDRLEVTISDSGVGVSPEAVKRIFEPFEQESNSSKRSFGGIGLGLAISKEVVELHGGTISVKSTVGKGSTFFVLLPVTADAIVLASMPPDTIDEKCFGENNTTMSFLTQSQSKTAFQRRHSDSSCRSPNFFGKNDGEKIVILSVDDDIVNQEVIKTALSGRYEIYIAMSGFEALEYFSTRSILPDLVLLDVMMPGMDGFEVLKNIREDKKISPTTLPIIMLSAMEPLDKATIQSLKSGANDYVSKPFDPEILKARVGTSVEMKRLRHVENESFHHSRLLHDILPMHIVERLVLGEKCISESHDSVCLLFSDIVGWTPMSESVPTHQLIDLLNTLFSAFDELTEKHGVFKAETIGDAYIVAAGHEGQTGPSNATLRVVEFAMDMLDTIKLITPPSGIQLQIRVGIHTGPAYSGVVGNKVPKYTFFGDTVNTAARMESCSVPGCINMSSSTHLTLSGEIAACRREGWLEQHGASFVKRSAVEVKGKGAMDLYLLCPKGVSPPYAKRLSLPRHTSLMRKSPSSLLSVDEKEESLGRETKLNEELSLEALKKEHNYLQTSERSAWAKVEQLELNLAKSNAKLLQSNRRSSQRSSQTSRTTPTYSALPQDSSISGRQEEDLRLQLRVTTKSLMRARQALMDKEAEIDEMELELERLKATHDTQFGSSGEMMLNDTMSVHSRTDSFLSRTQNLRETSPPPPTRLITCRRSLGLYD